MSTIWNTLKDDLRTRREARTAHRRLTAELATYRTPAEIEDLLAAVDASDGEDVELIRTILTDNLRAYHHPSPLHLRLVS